jgi:transglutaminase-like putative cysteine protease
MERNQIMVLSFDRPTFPRVALSFAHTKKHKLTFGWYRPDDFKASMKTTLIGQDNVLTLLEDPSFRDRNNCESMLFALDKSIATQRLNHRDWFISINLHDPKKPVNHAIFSSKSSSTTNVKNSEKIYTTWLTNQLNLLKVEKLNQIEWTEVYALLTKIDEDNPCTVMLFDGQDSVFYQGTQFTNAFYYTRSCPPHDNNGLLKTGSLQFQIDSIDLNHSLMVVSSQSINHPNSKFLNLKQMIVVRGGEIVWTNDPNMLWEKSVDSFQEEKLHTQDFLQKVKLIQIPYVTSAKKKKSFISISSDSLDSSPNIYSVTHKTVYEYDAPIYSSKHLIRLQPVHDLTQSIIYYNLSIYLDGKLLQNNPTNFAGAFGNCATFFEIEQTYQRLEIICHSIVSVAAPAPRRFDLLHLQRSIPLIWMPWDRIMMQAYLVPPELPESELRELSDYALSFVKRNNNDVFALLNDINRTIYNDFTYMAGTTSIITTPYDVYANHRGVCQDFANLFICLSRLLNIPARYRTGYIYTANEYANKGQGDATHAWLEVYLPYIGWQGYDPTNFCLAEKNHIRVACGRIYADTSPTSGTIYRGGGRETLSVDVRVVLLDDLDEAQFEW